MALLRSAIGRVLRRSVTTDALELDHTSKWMHNKHKKSPMQLINEVPPIEVPTRIFACTGANDPALGHPVEYICLDLPEPNVCKYCGLRKRVVSNDEDDDEERRLALEEVKLIQRQRERRAGIAAVPVALNSAPEDKAVEKEGESEKEELVLQDTFAQETAVNVEDPNMLKYVEQELAKKRGRQETTNVPEEPKKVEDDLYVIPDHLKVRKRNAEESSTQWTTGIAEVQLPLEYKLRNIEETEAAKKQLQDRRPRHRQQSVSTSIPSSYSADFSQRGRDHANKLRAAQASSSDPDAVAVAAGGGSSASGSRRQAATDEIMLERFRKRERSRLRR